MKKRTRTFKTKTIKTKVGSSCPRIGGMLLLIYGTNGKHNTHRTL